MENFATNIMDEQTGISYTLSPDGYYLPDLALPDEPEYEIGAYGMMRRSYLQKHRKGLFAALLMSGKLHEHLYEIDQAANDRFELISKQMTEREGVTEQLKSDDWLAWVQKMTSIHNRVQEIIREELIFS
jgi:hypothetical protein